METIAEMENNVVPDLRDVAATGVASIAGPPAAYIPTAAASKLLEALQRRGIRFAHWKSNSHLLKSLAGKTDLDLFVYPHDQGTFESTMLELGYKALRSQAWSSYPEVDDWLGMDDATGQLLHVHTHYAMVTGIQHVKHIRLPWSDAFFRHVVPHAQTGWPVPRVELEALVLLIRVWAKMPPLERIKKRPPIPPYIMSELVELLRQSDAGMLQQVATDLALHLPEQTNQWVQAIVEEKAQPQALALSRFLYQQTRPFYRMPWVSALALSFYHKAALKIRKYATRYMGPFSFGKKLASGGKVFALIGSDGSGKSTLSKDLIDWLTYKIDTHYVYLGKRPFFKSYNKRILFLSELLFSRNRWVRALRSSIGDQYYVRLIGRKIELLQMARQWAAKGSVVICDRVPQRQINGINDGPYLQGNGSLSHLAAKERRLFKQVQLHEPDVVFKLVVSPEVAMSRKPANEPELIHQKCAYVQQASFEKAAVVSIDATQPYEQVLLQVKREIWKRL